MNDSMNVNDNNKADIQQIEQDKVHPCPACESCTRERTPDRCTCFRVCPYYRCWLARIWRMVTAPLRHTPHYHAQHEGGDLV